MKLNNKGIKKMYEYRAHVLRVVDGDTVDVDIDLGFGIWIKNERVRIMGIDTPESRTRDLVEKIFGLAAKKRLEEILGEYSILRTLKPGKSDEKFGRILGDFILEDGRPVTQILLEEGHCVPYDGGNKADSEIAHLANRQKLMHEGVVDVKEVQLAEEKMKK
jgi:micrococcal nuclease